MRQTGLEASGTSLRRTPVSSALRMWKEDRARGDRMPAFLLCMMHLRAGRRKRSCPLHGARLLCPDSV